MREWIRAGCAVSIGIAGPAIILFIVSMAFPWANQAIDWSYRVARHVFHHDQP